MKDFIRKSFGFSLVELMISLITVSVIAAAFTPIITKKLKSSTVSAENVSEISQECNRNNPDGSYSFSSSCALCEKNACLICSITCGKGKTKNTSKCKI